MTIVGNLLFGRAAALPDKALADILQIYIDMERFNAEVGNLDRQVEGKIAFLGSELKRLHEAKFAERLEKAIKALDARVKGLNAQ